MVINLVDPRAIVLGGGVSNNERIFRNVPAQLERFTVAKQLRTRSCARSTETPAAPGRRHALVSAARRATAVRTPGPPTRWYPD